VHESTASFARGSARNCWRIVFRQPGPFDKRLPPSEGNSATVAFGSPCVSCAVHCELPIGAMSPRIKSTGTGLLTGAESSADTSGTFHFAHHACHGNFAKVPTNCGHVRSYNAAAPVFSTCT